jgi:hypothetical protein
MSDIESSVEKKNSGQLGTRVPLNIEEDLLGFCKKERRSMSQTISILLTEYVPIRKMILDNRYLHFDIVRQQSSIEFKNLCQEPGYAETLRVITSNGLDPDFINDLDLETVKEFAANLMLFIIECSINGKAV